MTCPACTRHTCPDPAVCRSILTPTVTAERPGMNARCLLVGVPLGLAGWVGIWKVLEMCGVVG